MRERITNYGKSCLSRPWLWGVLLSGSRPAQKSGLQARAQDFPT